MSQDAKPEREGQRLSALQAMAVFLERRSLVMLTLGFASGLPNLLIFDTLSAWLRDAGLSLEVIGAVSLATLAYSLKFLWAPLVDRVAIPGLSRSLGRRRAWMLVCQGLIIAALLAISGVDPAANLPAMAALAVLVGFISATQDIVIDAWRIEAAGPERAGALAAAYQWGYRIAMILAGILPLALSDAIGWGGSYALMAGLMLAGTAGVLAAPREGEPAPRAADPEPVAARPGADALEWAARGGLVLLAAGLLGSGLSGDPFLLRAPLAALGFDGPAEALTRVWAAKPAGVVIQVGSALGGLALLATAALPTPGRPTRPGRFLFRALGEPLTDFIRRHEGTAGLILALICLYRLPDFVLNIMNPFYLDLGFSKLEIAEVRKVLGVAFSVVGVGLGGWAVARLGLMRALVIGAFAGPVSNLAFAWLTMQGPQVWALAAAIGVDNLASGFAGTCLIAYMSGLTSRGFTASQYALFSSLYALLGKLVASQSGRIVEGAARLADAPGGFRLPAPPGAFSEALAKSGVSAAGLGTGYAAFFIYSALLGVAGVILTLMVAGREARLRRAEAAAVDQTPA
ncbi:MAG: AmpG family muropeptide MFS transporter [Phenylobacterium sp.]